MEDAERIFFIPTFIINFYGEKEKENFIFLSSCSNSLFENNKLKTIIY